MNTSRWVLIAGLLGLSVARAQDYKIPIFVISGAAGVSGGGDYLLHGAIGQPDAGQMTGGAFGLDGGFWALAAGEAMPGAPLLSITRQAEAIVVSWPVSAEGFVLEQTAALLVPAPAWEAVTLPIRTNLAEVSVTVAPPVGTRFYRLVRP